MKIRFIAFIAFLSLNSFTVANAKNNEAFSAQETADSACIASRHALYDLGSGSTKLTVLEVNSCNKPTVVLLRSSEKVDYKEDLLKSKSGEFSKAIQSKGLQALKALKKSSLKFEPSTHKAVATAAFREAKNGASFAKKISEKLEISTRVISQEEEGQLAFHAVSAHVTDELKNAIVWDIGGGSFQFVSKSPDWKVFKGLLASVSFKEKVNSLVKKQEVEKSPNPLTAEEVQQARNIVKQELGSLLKAEQIKFRKVYGIGGVLNSSIRKHLNKDIYTAQDIDRWIEQNHAKHDPELNDAFASTVVTNMILVSEIMKMTGIEKVQSVDAALVEGLIKL